MNHAVRTFKPNGTLIYESKFETAEKAYEEYCDIIDNLTKNLPKGQIVIVTRFNNNRMMTQRTIAGRV